jgi:hypothetical protein
MRLMPILVVLVLSMSVEFIFVLIPSAPPRLSLLLDALIGFVAVIVFVKIIVERSWAIIPAKYLILLLTFTYVCIAGLVINSVSPETAFAGTRYFFRYVPVFLLPFAFKLEERDQKIILGVLTIMALAQLPVSIWQRFFLFSDLVTGDEVRGTYASSTSIAVNACIGLVFALTFYLKSAIGVPKTVMITLALLIPPSLAETKVTPVLIVVGLVVLLWQFRKQLFVVTYSLMYSPEEGAGYFDVVTDQKYNYQFENIEAPKLEFNDTKRTDIIGKYDPSAVLLEGRLPGRIDSILMPFESLWPHEPLALMLGLGIGNVSSKLGDGGAYYYLAERMLASGTTISHLIWETGIIGCVIYLTFLILLFFDCLKQTHDSDEFISLIAMALIPTSAIIGIALIYTNLFFVTNIMLPYLFMMALVIADRRRAAAISTRTQQLLSGEPTAVPV